MSWPKGLGASQPDPNTTDSQLYNGRSSDQIRRRHAAKKHDSVGSCRAVQVCGSIQASVARAPHALENFPEGFHSTPRSSLRDSLHVAARTGERAMNNALEHIFHFPEC